MSDEQQHMALPRLYGGPAYSRPPRPVQEIVRPFDPDELPLEADRTEIDDALVSELTGATWSAPPPAKSRKGRRGRAQAQSAVGVATNGTATGGSAKNGDGHARLEGRPFSLRGLGRLFGGDRK
ncbi:MAG: hypothetical protein ACRDGI_05170 [Candidatus Limnocylindrales bacterium]